MHLVRGEDRIVFHWATSDHAQKFRLSAHLPNLVASYDEQCLGDRLYREPITWSMDCWPYDSDECEGHFPDGLGHPDWPRVTDPISKISILPSGQ